MSPLFPPLYEFQKKALEILQKKDPTHLLCIASTGSGKSLIFQKFLKNHPAKKALLISPLNALSIQHFRDFQKLGIKTQFLSPYFTENQGLPEESQVWIMSPEKIFNAHRDLILKKLIHFHPEFLIVDECHCVFEWGASFRTSFKDVLNLAQKLKIQKSIWLTATLEIKYKSILKNNFPNNFYEYGQFQIPQNLFLSQLRIPYANRSKFLLDFLKEKKPESNGVIFTASRKTAENIYSLFHQSGYSCAYFHAGISIEEKKILTQLLLNKKIKILIATTAFGMGMNYDYFEWGIAYQPLFSISQLAQALGRIGRNKEIKKALGLILWDIDDFYKLFKNDAEKNKTDQSQVLELFNFLKSPLQLNEKFMNHFCENS